VFTPDHLHVLIKGHLSNPPRETEVLNEWFRDLVEKVRMVVVAGPTSVYIDEPGNEGLTGTVTLATSHASIHIWDVTTPAMFQFDLYSCSCFEVEEVLAHFSQFDLLDAEWMFIDRNDSLTVKATGKWEAVVA